MDAVIERSNRVHEKHKIHSLKEKQSECLVAAKSSDVLAVLPTGFGKTIIIQCLPFLKEEDSLVVIISPLNTIIAEQAARFSPHCTVVNSEFIESLDSDKVVSDILDKKILYTLGHPEQITSMDIKKLLMKEPLAKKVQNLQAPTPTPPKKKKEKENVLQCTGLAM